MATPTAYVATGRRKEPVARVASRSGAGQQLVNGTPAPGLPSADSLVRQALQPLGRRRRPTTSTSWRGCTAAA